MGYITAILSLSAVAGLFCLVDPACCDIAYFLFVQLPSALLEAAK